MTLRGLQSHFGYLRGPETMADLARLGVEICRIGTAGTDIPTMIAMISEVGAVNIRPFPVVDDLDHLASLPVGLMCEWGNEPDGDIDPTLYRQALDKACAIAQQRSLQLWAPAISNLSDPALKWLNAVRDAGHGWPAGLHGISAHSYGPFPHKGFASRDAEVKWLKVACAGLPFLISEWGLATADGVSDAEQAQFYTDEWAFWERHGAFAAIAYQLDDGLGTSNEQNFGIRRSDGTWKPSALTFHQQEQSMAASQTALFTFDHASVIHNADGTKSLRWDKPGRRTDANSTRVFSLQPDGSYDDRPDDAIGPWEKGTVENDRLVFRVENARATFAWQS